MAQPTPYNRLYDFSDYQEVNPTKPLRGSEVDAEFDAIKLTTDQLRANAALIQRDDGALANQVVTPDSLSAGALAMIHQGEYVPRGAWAGITAYNLGDVVTYNAATYLCIVAHTAQAAFPNDLALGRWLLIANGALTGQASAIDLFEGNGTTTAYPLSFNYANSNAAVVFVGGVAQIPVQDFTISGTALTFVVAPPSPSVAGRKNVMVRGTGLEAQLAADQAKTAATNAQGFATSASTSATAAAASQTAAATSATNAATSASTATTQAGNASASATSASGSATAASGSATAASGSATAASGSATAAADSATAAAGSATTASTQATNAATSATTATTKASEASTSAANAGVSAEAALASKNAAAISEENAHADAAATASSVAQSVDGEKDSFAAGVDYTKGTSAQLTLTYTPAKSGTVQVFFDGVFQHLAEWSLVGNVVTFSSPIPSNKVEVLYNIPSQFVGLSNADLEVLGSAESAAQAAQVAAELAEANAETAQTYATTARNEAEAARDAAQLSAGVYASTGAGLAATTNGEYFNVPSGSATESLILYLNSAGTAVEQKRYPSVAALDNIRPESIRDSVNRRFVNVAGGTFVGGAANTTGAVKITLPAGVPSTYMVLYVTIMDNYGSMSLQINGSNTTGGWFYTSAVVKTTHIFLRSPQIRWGNDGTNDCIWIGEASYTGWAYPQVWVDRVEVSLNAAASFSTGWSVSLATSFAGTVSSGPKRVFGSQTVNADAISDVLAKRVFNPAGGTFAGGASDTTGALKIKLPTNASRTNIVIGVTIMDNYGVMQLKIAGFNNAGAWNYGKATIESNHQFQPEPSVRWGNDSTGDCIWISDLGVNYWAYPQVWITDVQVNAGSADWAASGWAISLVTSFDTVTAGPVTPVRPMPTVNPTFSGTLNGGNVNFPFNPGGTYLGHQAGRYNPGNGTYNTFVGYQCGSECTTGYNNAFGGFQSGKECTTGYGNSAWGLQVLQNLTSGAFNSAYGIHALLGLQTGIANVAVGGGCMQAMTGGSSNTAIGMYAGRDNQGNNNVFIGNRAAQAKTTGDNELHIANNGTSDLITGNFADNRLWVGGGTDDGVNEFQIEGSLRFKPDSLSTPASNGDLTFEATSNTSLKIKFKGSDGVVRSATLALS